MKKVIATVIETNEYEIKIDVENDATEDETRYCPECGAKMDI